MNAPNGSVNLANVVPFRRIRDAAPDGSFRLKTNKFSKDYLPKRIGEGHEEWIEHPDYPNRETFVFADEYMESGIKGTDYRMAYQSVKYPWLEAVQSYFIAAHNPHDYDVIPISIPGFHGVGHYVVWYMERLQWVH